MRKADLALVRPVPAFFCAVLRWIQPAEPGRCLTGVAVLAIAIRTSGLERAPYAVLCVPGWAFVGTVAHCAFWADLAFLAFWLRSSEPVNELAAAWRGFGRYPPPSAVRTPLSSSSTRAPRWCRLRRSWWGPAP